MNAINNVKQWDLIVKCFCKTCYNGLLYRFIVIAHEYLTNQSPGLCVTSHCWQLVRAWVNGYDGLRRVVCAVWGGSSKLHLKRVYVSYTNWQKHNETIDAVEQKTTAAASFTTFNSLKVYLWSTFKAIKMDQSAAVHKKHKKKIAINHNNSRTVHRTAITHINQTVKQQKTSRRRKTLDLIHACSFYDIINYAWGNF